MKNSATSVRACLACLSPSLTLALIFLAGCVNLDPVPDPTRSFVFEALGKGTGGELPEGVKPLAVVVERVELPPYLQDRRLMTRRGEFELNYSSIYRWGEPFDEGIARAVAEYLVDDPAVGEVAFFPWKTEIDGAVKIRLRLLRFEVWEDGRAELRVVALLHPRWSGADPAGIVMDRSYEESVKGSRVEDRIRAQSLLLRQLANDLLLELKRL